MAWEAILRRFESFQSDAVRIRFDDLANRTRPGDFNVFATENVVIWFAPLMSPNSILVTQDQHSYKKCAYLLAPPFTPPGFTAEGVQGAAAGALQEGRLRRKNLLGSDGVLKPSTHQPGFESLLGVDPNRALTTDSVGSSHPLATDYRGWGATAPVSSRFACPEARAVYSLLDRAVRFQRASSAIVPPNVAPPPGGSELFGGAALLDVHTPQNLISYSTRGPAPASGPDRFAAFAELLKKARIAVNPNFTPDGTTTGTVEYLARNVYRVPHATVELYYEQFYAVTHSLDSTASDARFVVEDNTANPASLFNKTIGDAERTIDTALDFAAGPPVLSQVIVAKPKGARAWSDLAKVGDETEVLYWKTWKGTGPRTRAQMDELAPYTPPNVERYLGGPDLTIGAVVSMTVVLGFSKPMRGGNGDPGPITVEIRKPDGTGVSILPPPGSSQATWLDSPLLQKTGSLVTLGCRRYERDTWVATVSIPASPGQGWTVKGRLHVAVKDRSDLNLDGDPSTVAVWDPAISQFAAYEDSALNVTTRGDGGTDDSNGLLWIDTSPPRLRKE